MDTHKSARYITTEYLPKTLKLPDRDYAAKYFNIITCLPGNCQIKNVDMLLQTLLGDYKLIYEYGKEHCKKQCIEFAQQLDLKYDNNICSTWSDLCELWGSKEGLDQHHRIWQVR